MSVDRLPRLDLSDYLLNCILGAFDPNIVFLPTRNQTKSIANSVILNTCEKLTSQLHQRQSPILIEEVECEEVYRSVLFGSIVAEGLQEGYFVNSKLKANSYRYTLRNVMANIMSQLHKLNEIDDPRRKLGYKVSLEIPIVVNNMPWQLEGSYFVRHSGVGPITSISATPVKTFEK